MGREAELFKYVEINNVHKVKKLLESSSAVKSKGRLHSSLKKFRSTSDLFHVNKLSPLSTSNGNIHPSSDNGKHGVGDKASEGTGNGSKIIARDENTTAPSQQPPRHVNVNWKHPTKGTSPLLQATLLGYYDMVDLLLQSGADPNVTDNKGNTALHLAVFTSRSDIMELLLNSKIKVNVTNDDGNTALHLAAQQCSPGKKYILMKLLKAGSRLCIHNSSGMTAVELAAVYDRYDGVSLLLECEPALYKRCNLALIEASIRGHTRIIHLLLENRADPNTLNLNRGTRAIHEACRFLRYEATELLLKYGADITLKNSKMETPHSILSHYPHDKAEPFLKLLKAYSDGSSTKDNKCNGVVNSGNDQHQNTVATLNIPDSLPLLPNKRSWTQNSAQYCSSCTSRGVNTNILDDDPRTFWTIPSVSPSWVLFDLHEDHVITGVRITGWRHPNMIRQCQLQAADTPYGTWQVVHEFTCQMLGTDDPLEPGVCQEFPGCKYTSRYWRLWIKNNHGGDCMCFQGVRFYGCQRSLCAYYEESGLQTHVAAALLARGCNTVEALADLSEGDIRDVVGKGGSEEEYERVRELIMDKRSEVYPMTELHWATLPVSCVVVGKPLPDFTVTSSPNVCEQLEVLSYTSKLSGTTRCQLVPRGNDKPSAGTFRGVIMNECGNYLLEVRSVRYPWLSIRTKRQIRVVSAPEPLDMQWRGDVTPPGTACLM